ncbi:ribosomal protection-like ABC-F family protein [Sebaldella sp. S0638]|uniref:ribosomal protection-like ABC-F family protein n=1 Tax=Sebaldella sp. S0638 TaxID=2957809 RepID=UPI00209FED6D|nr:ABC-F type ribosomal protection protein [Sebaldella sp. S0638]MCP1223164.1 ABC-F type ribosomal protection protein [Sebaldella sp. S0638]
MSLIDINNLTFSYETSYENIFEDVSFQIDTDWKLGFIGRNGRGKTTFLNLLLGKYEYRGKISSSVTFDYFPFEVEDKSRDTIDIIDSVNSSYELWELNREFSWLDVDQDVLYRPFETLSNGEQTKVLLAALLLKEQNFLLLDEPTNHLDEEGKEIIAEYLKTKKGFILVSHDRDFLDKIIDHVLSVNKTNIDIMKGNFSDWNLKKEREDNLETAENERLKKDIGRLKQAAKRTSAWSEKTEDSKFGTREGVDRGFLGHKSAKMMKKSKNIEARQNKAIEEKSGLLKNIETAENLKLHSLVYPKGSLADISDLSIFYGDKVLFEGLEFSVMNGDRVAVKGKNGSGKSSLIKLLAGEDIPHSGLVKTGSGLIISYVPQDASFLSGTLRSFAEDRGIDETLFKSILRKLDFDRGQFDKKLDEYSEGQKKKVLLAGSLSESAHLYIWDEPLNFIDVISRIQIEELILNYNPTLIYVEHDSAFNRKTATKIINL